MPEHEVAADWDAEWERQPLDVDAPAREQGTVRWREQERLVRLQLGGFDGLRAIEIGAGRGVNALLYALRGATVTLLDRSATALRQAEELFSSSGATAEFVEADLFDPPADLVGTFDVSMSFGVCEHFLGRRRLEVVRAHLDLVRPSGLALIGVPNRYGVVYRLWMGALKARGTWSLGTEVPFSATELRTLVHAAGGEPLPPIFGSLAASVVDHGLNQVLYKLGRDGLRVPQVRLPVLDRLAYELVVPAVKR